MPRPAQQMLRLGRAYHGVAFAPDGHHLAFTEIGTQGFVEVAEAATGRSVCRLENPLAPQKPKGVAFTPDGRWLFVSYGPSASAGASRAGAAGGALGVHRYHARNGRIDPHPVAASHAAGEVLGGFDSCAVLPCPTRQRTIRVLAVDQAGDRMLAFDFDPRTRTISAAGEFVDNLSFPHAVAASADGRFVATANYGDDTVRIEEVPAQAHRPSLLQRVGALRFLSTWR
jgi:DNA-binding beta-propeller fold protein YncE